MLVGTMVAAVLMAQAPAQVEVGYEELAQGREAAAIATIESNEALEENDPARLINLGIAYARQGREDAAQAMFEAAATSAKRYDMETAAGKWVDSRDLARRALAMLDRGEFTDGSRMTMR